MIDCNTVCLSELEFASDFSLRITNSTDCTVSAHTVDLYTWTVCSAVVFITFHGLKWGLRFSCPARVKEKQ